MPVRDLGLAAGLLVVCGLVLWGSRGLAPSTFEPLGPAAFPVGLAAVIAALTLLLVARSFLEARKAGSDSGRPAESSGDPDEAEDEVPRRPAMAVAILALAVGFGLALHFVPVGFAWTSLVFLVAAMTVMTRFRLAAVPATLAIAVVTAFGSDYLLTHVLTVRLP